MQRLQVLSIIFFLQSHAAAFTLKETPVKVPPTVPISTANNNGVDSRRSFLDRLALVPLVAGLSVSVNTANASGGATAGGESLLSEKQRYNQRVKDSARGLLAAGDSLKVGGSTTTAKAYFSTEGPGGYKDLTAAGYPLSNAFRRSSETAPDKLTSVKVR
jgi:hypothetical protein